MTTFLYIILATGSISLLSFIGVTLLFFQEQVLKRISIFLVAFAAGALVGAAFLHLLPEAIGDGVGDKLMMLYPLLGFVGFFLLEKVLHWHHTHSDDAGHAPLGLLSLIGDGMHNFLDGVILAAAFLVDIKLGLAATAAVALHEIPQEISEFGVLVYAGFTKRKALFFNFISATSVILGGVVGYLLLGVIEQWIPAIILFAVGTFLYLAASDFVPEIRKEEGFGKSLKIFFIFGSGILLMWLFTLIE